eukprot:GFKZ01013050.1.p1 GENE.GFKZ01013050.1~~GFKZ01013050.1.p1  ORF type:complete len:686 (-),score=64.99 GFKZ01013050.1:1888-3945(-)
MLRSCKVPWAHITALLYTSCTVSPASDTHSLTPPVHSRQRTSTFAHSAVLCFNSTTISQNYPPSRPPLTDLPPPRLPPISIFPQHNPHIMPIVPPRRLHHIPHYTPSRTALIPPLLAVVLLLSFLSHQSASVTAAIAPGPQPIPLDPDTSWTQINDLSEIELWPDYEPAISPRDILHQDQHVEMPSLLRLDETLFFENYSVAAGFRETRPSTKFGGPCVADLDGDGNYDLVLSHHNRKRTRILFSNGDGTFTYSPFETRVLDIHGISVALRTAVGRERLLAISVGGGNGGKLKIPEMYIIDENRTITDISEKDGFGQVATRGRNTVFMDLAMRTSAVGRQNLGGPDALVTSFLGNVDMGLRQFAYRNTKGKFSLETVPVFELQKRGRIEVTDVDDDQIMEVISIRDLEFYRLVEPFSFQEASEEFLPKGMHIVELSVTAVVEIDIDNDGYFDLFVTRATRDLMTKRKPAPPNSTTDILLYNQGGRYVNITGEAGLSSQLDSMGVTAGDFNNDGYVDLFVVQYDEPDYFLVNQGDRTFRRVDGLVPKDESTVGNHAAAVDYDLDGRVDVIVGHGGTELYHGVYTLMKNVMPLTDSNHWLLVKVANEPTRAVTAIHAVVTVYVNGQRMKRRVGSRGVQGGGSSYVDTVHFGLGTATRVDCVRVQWTNQIIRKVTDVEADQKISFGVE